MLSLKIFVNLFKEGCCLKLKISAGLKTYSPSPACKNHSRVLEDVLTLIFLVANLANKKMMQKSYKMTENLAHGYSSESTYSVRAFQ